MKTKILKRRLLFCLITLLLFMTSCSEVPEGYIKLPKLKNKSR